MLAALEKGVCVGEVWVRVLGLPVHLWGKDFFTRLSDADRDFVAVDEEKTERRHMKWARILLKSSGRNMSGKLLAVDREVVFAVQLWWEVPLCLTMVISMESCRDLMVRDEWVGSACMVRRVKSDKEMLMKTCMGWVKSYVSQYT